MSQMQQEMIARRFTSALLLVLLLFALSTGCASDAPAEFTVSSLQITPTEPVTGQTITISADVHNSGDREGSYSSSLMINGATIDTKDVNVAGGATETLSFSISAEMPGTYGVEMAGLTGTFTVLVGGTVFEDADGDGSRDTGEEGIPGVLVSNGVAVSETDSDGVYRLPPDTSSVFLTVPPDHTPTSAWYGRFVDSALNFGLNHTPEKNAAEFTFVQMTDMHLDLESLPSFDEVVDEINALAPAFVVATGDLVNGADGATVSQAEEWFDAYADSILGLEVPIYHALGNHDVAGIHCDEASGLEQGYDEGLYRSYFGPTYYSFDWGQYHCVVLDPNDLADGQQVYRISESQLDWLEEDLSFRQESPLLVFCHEPTTSWEGQSQVIDILDQHETAIFCGHLHQDILMDTQGISEQVTGALCGEWWYGGCPDGMPQGYRIVSVDGEDIDTFYKGTGSERTIRLDLPGPVLSGEIDLVAKIYSENGSILGASYRIDGGTSVAMQVESGSTWATATAVWDSASVSEGYHTITIEATDGAAPFSEGVEVKVAEDETVPISELVSHFDAYKGWFTTIQGTVQFAAAGPPFTAEGTGGIKLSDGTGEMIIFAGDCKSPALPTLSEGQTIQVKAVPLKFSWDFLSSTEENYSLMADVALLVPEELLERDGQGNIEAIKVMRLLSGADLTLLSD
jgi:hypothetical protein